MAKVYETQKKALEAVYPHLDEVIEFLTKKMKVSEAMPSAKIHAKLGKNFPVALNQFKMGFSVAVNTGILVGMKGAKRSGFRRIGAVSKSDIVPDDIETENYIREVAGLPKRDEGDAI